ncbi:MAG: hypothetical protein P8Z00_10835 [Anaerolineales bacterium]
MNLLERVPDSAVNRAANSLLDLRETWENSTKEERKDFVHIMLKEVGVDVEVKRVLWIKPQPDYEPLFSILGKLSRNNDRHFWLENFETQGDNRDIDADIEQVGTGVEIELALPKNAFTRVEEYIK